MKIMNTTAFVGMAVLALSMGCGDRTTNGGVDTSILDAEALQLDLPLDQFGNPWDLGKSDKAKTDTPTQYGTTISEIQNSDESKQCLDGFNNYAEGFQLVDVVVTAPRFKASSSLDGYFVAEAGLTTAEPWKGIAVTLDNAQGTDWEAGTVLSLMVDHLEYYCLTELEIVSHQVKGSAAVPAPLTINPADVGSQSADTAEQYEGVLVQVLDVEVTNANVPGSDGKDHGMFEVTGGLVVANDYHLNYMNPGTDQRTVGDKFDAIIGIVSYSYGQYIILPRWNTDLIPEGGLPDTPPPPETTPEPVPDVSEGVMEVTDPGGGQDVKPETTPTGKTVHDIQSAKPSVQCTVEEQSKLIEANVKLTDVVVASPQVFVSGIIRGYYVSDAVATATDYTGILVTFPSDWTLDFAMGDLVTITGDYVEHFCLSEIDAATMVKTGTGTVPAAAVVGAEAFGEGGGAASEPWEGVFVKMDDVFTVQDAAGGSKPAWWFKVKTGSVNNIFISNNFDIDEDNANTPALNDGFTSIAGFVKYSWGTYLVAPHTIADLVKQ